MLSFVFGWGLPSPIIKSHQNKKWAWPWARELSKFLGPPLIFLQRLKLATSHLVYSLGLPRPIIKLHPKEKWVRPWAKGVPPNFVVPL